MQTNQQQSQEEEQGVLLLAVRSASLCQAAVCTGKLATPTSELLIFSIIAFYRSNMLLVQKSTADQNGSDCLSCEEKVKTMTARDPMKALPKARLVSIKLCMHEFSILKRYAEYCCIDMHRLYSDIFRYIGLYGFRER